MMVAPVAMLLTKPLALMAATPELDDFHSTTRVISCVLLSLKVPVAVNCLFASRGMVELAGAIASETSVALVSETNRGALDRARSGGDSGRARGKCRDTRSAIL